MLRTARSYLLHILFLSSCLRSCQSCSTASEGGEINCWASYDELVVRFLKELDESRKQGFREHWDQLAKDLISDVCLLEHLELITDSQLRRDASREENLAGGPRCGLSALKGRRPTQEDCVICIPGILIPSLLATQKTKEFALLGVFDGHGGSEASRLSAHCFDKYLLYHMYNISVTILDKPETFSSLYVGTDRPAQDKPGTDWLEGYFWRNIMREALLRAFVNIEEAFLRNADGNGLEGGTTACIAIETDGHVLIANLGDSKALFCTSAKEVPETLNVEELTADHHPDRSDEKLRIEASGGYVKEWGGVARVNGILAVSRSIGDLSLKKYGVVSQPEFTDWKKITGNNKYLVLASDGVFESMTTQDVCAVIEAVETRTNISKALREKFLDVKIPIALPPPKMNGSSSLAVESAIVDRSIYDIESVEAKGGCDWVDSCRELPDSIADRSAENRRTKKSEQQSMAEALVGTALKLGSADNVAAVVYALEVFIPSHESDQGTIAVAEQPFITSSGSSELMRTIAGESGTCTARHVVPGIMGRKFCYALMEPLEREAIFPAQHDAGDGNLGKASGSVERLCASGAFAPVSVLPSEEEENRGQLDVPFTALGASIQHEFYQRPEKLSGFLNRIASVPFDSESMPSVHITSSYSGKTSPPYTMRHYRYILKKKFARGSFGEIWLATRRKCDRTEYNQEKTAESYDWHFYDAALDSDDSTAQEDEIFVLKQILLNGHPSVRLSGLREKYFGEVFANASRSQIIVDEGLDHIARFVDSFVVEGRDLWLVFKKEGQSLSRLLYELEGLAGINGSQGQDKAGSFQVLRPSAWWRWLKSTKAGKQEMRSILHQLLLAVKACHDRNITHRDIKPENMVVQAAVHDSNAGPSTSNWPMNLILRVIDFGSAIDPFTLQHLYGSSGPTRNEHTAEYAPPEALLLIHWLHFHPEQTKAYDMWSIGVVMLETILGTPHVFQISSRTRILLDKSLAGWDQDSRDVAYMLRAFMEMCILLPRVPPRHRHEAMNQQEEGQLASMECGETALLHKFQQRDPLGLGVPDIWALRLLRQLLQWYPEDRISVEEALQHPYFYPNLQE